MNNAANATEERMGKRIGSSPQTTNTKWCYTFFLDDKVLLKEQGACMPFCLASSQVTNHVGRGLKVLTKFFIAKKYSKNKEIKYNRWKFCY